jgi:hypothetical protein
MEGDVEGAGWDGGRERTSSFLSGMAGCQMLKAGLAQDESDDDEDGRSGAEVGLGGESGSGRASSNASGLDSGVDVPGSKTRGAVEPQQRQGHGQLARKNVRKGKRPKRIVTVPRSKMQIMASVEVGDDDDDDDDDDEGGDEDDESDEDGDGYGYGYDAVYDIVGGPRAAGAGRDGRERGRGLQSATRKLSEQGWRGVVQGRDLGRGKRG